MAVKMVVEYTKRDWVDPTPIEPEEAAQGMPRLAEIGAVFRRIGRQG